MSSNQDFKDTVANAIPVAVSSTGTEDVADAVPMKRRCVERDSNHNSSELNGITQSIHLLLGNIAELLSEQHAASIYSEIADCPDRFIEDSRKMYRDLAQLELTRSSLVRKHASGENLPYDEVLVGLKDRLVEECKWLVKRFQFIYFKLRDEGEPYLHIMDISECVYSPVNKSHNAFGIGPYILDHHNTSMPMQSDDFKYQYGLNIRSCDREMFIQVADDLITLMAKENKRILKELGSDRSQCNEQIYSEEDIKKDILDKIFTQSKSFNGTAGAGARSVQGTACVVQGDFMYAGPFVFPMRPFFVPLESGTLTKSYRLEWEIESLKRCRQTLVVFNNYILAYTELRSYKVSDNQPPYQLGLKKALVFPPHFQRFNNNAD